MLREDAPNLGSAHSPFFETTLKRTFEVVRVVGSILPTRSRMASMNSTNLPFASKSEGSTSLPRDARRSR